MPTGTTSLGRLLRLTVDDLAARLAGTTAVAATLWSGRLRVVRAAVGALTVCVMSRRAGSFREGTPQVGYHDPATVHAVTTLRLWAESELDRVAAVVERARGVLMGREGCSADAALALLEERAGSAALSVPAVAAAVLAEQRRATPR